MQKTSAYRAFLLISLLFVLIAAASFAAFTKTEELCTQAESCLRQMHPTSNGEMIWEVVSRQFLSLFPI